MQYGAGKKSAYTSERALNGSHAGFYTFPCDTTMTVALNMHGETFAIHPGDFNLGRTDADSKCVIQVNSCCVTTDRTVDTATA